MMTQTSSMQTHLRRALLLTVLLLVSAAVASAQSPTFTYQGRLQDGGTPANGSYDLQFKLFDAAGNPQGSPNTVTISAVSVSSGIFSVPLNFGGASAFPGADRFLEIGVKPAGSANPFTILTPRQQITSTPYAVRALSATTADNLTTTGSGSFIQNTTSPQTNSNFNISGNGTAGDTLSGNVVNATTQYNLGGNRVLRTGSFNTELGISAGPTNIGAGNNFVGDSAGFHNTNGSNNAFFGASAGFFNTMGNFNTMIGTNAGAGSNSLNNATAVGANAQVSQSDSLVLGSISGVNGAAANVNVGIGTVAPLYPLTVSGAARSGQFQGAVEFNNSSNDTGVRISNTAASGRTWTLFSSGGSTGLCAGCFSIYDATSGIRRLTLDPIGNIIAGTTSSGGNFIQSAPAGWGDAYRIFRNGSQVASIGMDSTATKLRLFVGASSDDSTVQVSVDSLGNVKARGQVTSNTTPDIAETIPADASVTAGDIVCADPLHREHVVRCSNRDRAVLGVISDGTGGFLINSNGKSSDAALTGKPLVLAGRVPVKVSLENGPIQNGDFLTASSTPGVAMRASDLGPTIGIALEAFNGEGVPSRNQQRFGTVLCFVKAGEGDTKAALARLSQSLMRMKDDNKQVTDENRRLQQENASLKTRLDRLEQQQSEVKQQQNQIELLKKLVCLTIPVQTCANERIELTTRTFRNRWPRRKHERRALKVIQC
jgi:hypothetical protein